MSIIITLFQPGKIIRNHKVFDPLVIQFTYKATSIKPPHGNYYHIRLIFLTTNAIVTAIR